MSFIFSIFCQNLSSYSRTHQGVERFYFPTGTKRAGAVYRIFGVIEDAKVQLLVDTKHYPTIKNGNCVKAVAVFLFIGAVSEKRRKSVGHVMRLVA